jgi:hypothetical protein
MAHVMLKAYVIATLYAAPVYNIYNKKSTYTLYIYMLILIFYLSLIC